MNNLPLFLIDVKNDRSFPFNVLVAVTHCKKKKQRVFPGCRASFKKASHEHRINVLENEKKNRLAKNTLHVGAAVQSQCNQDSCAGLTNHVTMRPDEHSEEEVVQDLRKTR